MKFKKVAITGHKNGIGKGFYDYFSSLVPTIGFDIVDGYDVDTDIETIVQQTMDCDLFINNACGISTASQSNLAKFWYENHKHENFFILNISSIVVRANLEKDGHLKQYYEWKKELEKTHNKINLSGNNCKSIVISPGIVDTFLVQNCENVDKLTFKIYNELKPIDGLLTVEDVVSTTINSLNTINERYFTSLIEINNRKMRL